MRILAIITDACAVREIVSHLGEPTSPPPLTPARSPPLWEMADAGQGEFDPQAQPAPHYELDPRIAWQRPHEDDPIGLGKNPACTLGRRSGLVGHGGDPGPSSCWDSGEARSVYAADLPSEAESEYACRAGTTTPYSFGETIDTQEANYNGNHRYAGVRKARTGTRPSR